MGVHTGGPDSNRQTALLSPVCRGPAATRGSIPTPMRSELRQVDRSATIDSGHGCCSGFQVPGVRGAVPGRHRGPDNEVAAATTSLVPVGVAGPTRDGNAGFQRHRLLHYQRRGIRVVANLPRARPVPNLWRRGLRARPGRPCVEQVGNGIGSSHTRGGAHREQCTRSECDDMKLHG